MKKRLFALLLALVLIIPTAIFSANAEDRILKYGCRGADVLNLQKRLNYYGYYGTKFDSYFGGDTQRAVEKFQTANHLKVDGKAGPATIALANSNSAISYSDYSKTFTLGPGSYGANVKELQQNLRDTYFYYGNIDGIFGADVSNAVKNFQQSCGLTVDGKVGKKTKDALYNRSGRIFTGGIPVRQLSLGCHGWDVYVLQKKLASLNYLSSYSAGNYNADTMAAVVAFEKANGLEQDGKVGGTVRRYLWPSAVDTQDKYREPVSGTRVLKKGKYGNDVTNLQMRLKSGGYLLGNADGIFGETTEKAVMRLQKEVGLKQDGIVGPSTWVYVLKLNIDNAENSPAVGVTTTSLRRGSKGANVTKLQKQLIQLSYLAAGSDDGKYGPLTAEAVKNFQTAVGIKADGVAGSQTFVKLNEALGVQWK